MALVDNNGIVHLINDDGKAVEVARMEFTNPQHRDLFALVGVITNKLFSRDLLLITVIVGRIMAFQHVFANLQ